MTTTSRLSSVVLVLVATTTAVAVWRLDGPHLARLLLDDAPTYAVAIGWTCVAPAPLLGALLATGRTPWPWVVTVALHLVVLTAAVVRLRHLAPAAVWAGLAASVVVGVVSVVAVTAAAPPRRPGSAPAPAPADPTSPPRG